MIFKYSKFILLTVMSESDSVVIHMRNETVHTEFIAQLRCGSYKVKEKLDSSCKKGLCHIIFQNRG